MYTLEYEIISEEERTCRVIGDRDRNRECRLLHVPEVAEIDQKKYKVVEIAAEAFKGCSELYSVYIMGETTICEQAFMDCDELEYLYLSKSVKEIKEKAFANCYFSKIKIPYNAIVDENAFDANVRKYRVKEENYDSLFYFNILSREDKTCELTECFEDETDDFFFDLEVPETAVIEGETYTVVRFCCRIFNNDVDNIYIPKSVLEIESIYNMSGVRKVIVDKSNPNYSSIRGALFSKDKRILLFAPTTFHTLPKTVAVIGEEAYSNWKIYFNVTINLPDSVTTICSGAFRGLALKNITIPESVVVIDDYAFADCDKMEELFIPKSVSKIGTEVFNGKIKVDERNPLYCSENGVLYNKDKSFLLNVPRNIKGEFVVPSSVKKISAYAFADCKSLKSITIPASTEVDEAELAGSGINIVRV